MPQARPISDGGGRAGGFEGARGLLPGCAARLRVWRAKFRIQSDNQLKLYLLGSPLQFRINDVG